MKNYKVECMHDVYVDSFERGELDHVNFFDTKGEYKVENPFEAIEKHLDSLGYDLKKEHCQIDEQETNKVWYSVLVDEENCKASDSEIELWKKRRN